MGKGGVVENFLTQQELLYGFPQNLRPNSVRKHESTEFESFLLLDLLYSKTTDRSLRVRKKVI